MIRPWLVLRAIAGLGDTTLMALVQALGSPASVLEASEEDLVALGCRQDLARAIRSGPPISTLRQIDDELHTLDRLGYKAVSYLHDDYPARLRMISDPPPVLYMAGRMQPEDRHAVAIVGSRRASQAGRLLTEELSRSLAAAGFTIVSGLARGVDAAAHRGALSAQGRTVGVLGCGIDRTYPPEHDRLRREIEQHGAILSELPIGSPPHSYHFPRRNRIISGLSLGVVVTEAAPGSGSLITARLAADQGRDVFAVPGSIKAETSRGPNGLIKEGARLVEFAEDVVEELFAQLDEAFQARLRLGQSPTAADSRPDFGKDEALVYDALSHEPQSMDVLVRKTGLSVSEAAAVLLALELKHCVRQLPGNDYMRL